MTNERQQAAKIRQNLGRQIEALRNQKNLTSQGRAARIAKAREDAKAKLAALRQEETDRLTSRRDELTKKLFGNTSPDDARIGSIRDARKRAAEIKTSNEMAEAMNLAEMDSDTVLLRAYAQECARRSSNPLERGWSTLFHQWADAQHYGMEVVQELRDIDTEFNDPTAQLTRDATFGCGLLPEELRGVGNLRALAAQADEIPELPPTRAEQVGNHLARFAGSDGGY